MHHGDIWAHGSINKYKHFGEPLSQVIQGGQLHPPLKVLCFYRGVKSYNHVYQKIKQNYKYSVARACNSERFRTNAPIVWVLIKSHFNNKNIVKFTVR